MSRLHLLSTVAFSIATVPLVKATELPTTADDTARQNLMQQDDKSSAAQGGADANNPDTLVQSLQIDGDLEDNAQEDAEAIEQEIIPLQTILQTPQAQAILSQDPQLAALVAYPELITVLQQREVIALLQQPGNMEAFFQHPQIVALFQGHPDIGNALKQVQTRQQSAATAAQVQPVATPAPVPPKAGDTRIVNGVNQYYDGTNWRVYNQRG